MEASIRRIYLAGHRSFRLWGLADGVLGSSPSPGTNIGISGSTLQTLKFSSNINSLSKITREVKLITKM